MTNALLHIADRVFNRPLLIHPSKADVILWVMNQRLPADLSDYQIDQAALERSLGPDASRFVGSYRREDGKERINRAYKGTALITIAGSLVNRGAWIGTSSGLVSYEGIGAQIREAANDPEVHSILLDIHSPGGEAAGMFGLAGLIREARKTKRIVAMVDDMAASAAYGLASAADEIVISESSMVGSIGVVLLHLDRSGELEKKGIKPTLIYAGAHKVDGHPFGPLPEGVREDLQREVMSFYTRFVESVAAGRGIKLSAGAAKATEARVFFGSEAIEKGLADRIASLDSVLGELSDRASRNPGRAQLGGASMDKDTVARADHDKAVADARAAGVAEGQKAERDRVSQILGLEEAKGREGVALALVKEGASVEMAKSVLAAAPKGAVATVADRARETERAALGGAADAPKAEAKSLWNKAASRHNAQFDQKAN